MFEPEKMQKEFETNRKSSLSPSSLETKFFALKFFREFCLEKYGESVEDIIKKIQKCPESVYPLMSDFKERETARGISIRVIKLRFTYIKFYLLEHGVKIDNSSKIKDVFGKTPKYLREPVVHDEICKIIMCSENHVKALIMIQTSSGMRISEVLQLRVGDFEKGERYKIRVRAETTKTKQERITYISEEAEEFVEPFLKGKQVTDRVIPYSKSGMVSHLSKAVRKAGVAKKYEHSKQLTITSHSFRAFFITQMGKLEGFVGHALAGHGHYMSEYDRYTPEDKLEKYIEGEINLKIFNRVNHKQMKNLERQLHEQSSRIEHLQEVLETRKEEEGFSKEELGEIKKNHLKLTLR